MAKSDASDPLGLKTRPGVTYCDTSLRKGAFTPQCKRVAELQRHTHGAAPPHRNEESSHSARTSLCTIFRAHFTAISESAPRNAVARSTASFAEADTNYFNDFSDWCKYVCLSVDGTNNPVGRTAAGEYTVVSEAIKHSTADNVKSLLPA